MCSADCEMWRKGYLDELISLKDMGIYILVPRLEVPWGDKIWKGRPIFKMNWNENGAAVQWKVQLVLKGFKQIYRKDYGWTTSPTTHMESWCVLLHLAASLGWDAQQVDIKTAFLYRLLPDNEVQYMEQPVGFEEVGKETWVWKLQ